MRRTKTAPANPEADEPQDDPNAEDDYEGVWTADASFPACFGGMPIPKGTAVCVERSPFYAKTRTYYLRSETGALLAVLSRQQINLNFSRRML